MFLRDYFV